MNFGKNPQHDFPKMRGGSTAVWNFSENSSVFEGTGFPYLRKPALVWTTSSAMIVAMPRKRQMARRLLGDVQNMMILDKVSGPAVVGQ